MRRRPITSEELDSYAADPRPGDVWWCDGRALGLPDGGKVRPVLVVHAGVTALSVIPLTTRKPAERPVPVSHSAGVSWLTNETRSVEPAALLSPLGRWSGFAAWTRGR